MPRRRRLTLANQPVHLIQRGNNRGRCFQEPDDYVLYLGLLVEHAKACGCAIHAYVLMTNHTHLLLTPCEADAPSRLMKGIGEVYVRHYNKRYSRSGTLWEGRFRSCLVDSEQYLMTCQRYIELNPVRAGMVRRPALYPWSSYRANVGIEPSLALQPHHCYVGLATSPGERQKRYLRLFDDPITEEQLQQIRDCTNGGYALGGEAFVAEVERLLKARARPGKPGKPARQRAEANRGLTPV